MNLLVALEAHFFRTPDGLIWSETIKYAFWTRYLQVYKKLVVIARVKDVSEPNRRHVLASGDFVEFFCLPDYTGPVAYIAVLPNLKKAIRTAIDACNCAILRVPGQIATLAWHELKKKNIPYALEVCGDPWESLAPGTIQSIFRPIARYYATRNLKSQCLKAAAISYVTDWKLQERYPAKYPCSNDELSNEGWHRKCYVTNYSSIDLDESAYFKKNSRKRAKSICILNVGSMTTLYKAQDIQIRAVKKCIERGYDIKLHLIGGGDCRSKFESLSLDLGVQERICFLGTLPGAEAVRNELDKADLFILPSLVEGLPRALLEAMARSLPCIATSVGGIPELLPEEDLVQPGDVSALVDKIIEVVSDEKRMEKMAIRNFEKAMLYRKEILDEQRVKLYSYLKLCVEKER